MLREAISKHPWSFLSMLISVGTAIVTLILIQYLYRHGSWRPQSSLGSEIQGFGGNCCAPFVCHIVGCHHQRAPPGLWAVGVALERGEFLSLCSLKSGLDAPHDRHEPVRYSRPHLVPVILFAAWPLDAS